MTKEPMRLQAAFEAVEQEVERILGTAPVLIRSYTSHLAKARGKFIRTQALLACALDEQDMVDPDAVIFGSAIEILHLATLVHDDIMDEADVRRGIPTIQKKFGKRTAVICGDYLLSAALKQMGNTSDADKYKGISFPNYVQQICMGELRQNMNSRNYRLSMYRYLSIINGKTAALFEAACFAGAVTHERDETRLAFYRQLGRYTGVIFQLTDDCIDYEADEDRALKNVRSDYDQGVITLPLIYTFRQNEEALKKAESQTLSKEEALLAVKKSGGTGYTRQIAKRYYDKAEKAIEGLKPGAQKEQHLKAVLDKSYYGLAYQGI